MLCYLLMEPMRECSGIPCVRLPVGHQAHGRALWPATISCLSLGARGLPGWLRKLSSSGLAVGSFQHHAFFCALEKWLQGSKKRSTGSPGFPSSVCLPHYLLPRTRSQGSSDGETINSLIPGADTLLVDGGSALATSHRSLELALNIAWVPGRGGRRLAASPHLASPPRCTPGRKSPFFQGALTLST